MNKTAISFCFFLCSQFGFAAPTASKSTDLLDSVSQKYQAAGMVQADFTRETSSEFEIESKKANGEMSISKSLFRLDFKDPKGLMVYDGAFVWDVPGEGKTATRMKLNNGKADQVSVAALINKSSREKNFNLKKAPEGKSLLVEYSFAAKSSKSELKSFNLTIDKEQKVITEIEYADSGGNKTVYKLSNTKFNKEKKAALFIYTPGPKTQVNDL